MGDQDLGTEGASAPEDDGDDRIHPIQSMLDNPFLLLFLGVTMPTVLYTIWGIMEVVQIPISQ